MVRTAEAGNTRERILQVALDLFGRQGYSGTSIRDIANRMGMTKAAVYHHFPSKENLLADILTPAMTRVGHVLTTAGLVRTSEQRRALVTAHSRTIKLMGLGMASAVLLDAFLIRILIVYAVMHRIGPANWWLPHWLDRVLPHLSVEGSDVEHTVPPGEANWPRRAAVT